MEARLIKIDRNGTKYYEGYDVCPKCDGKKRIENYLYHDGGICYKCGGTGMATRKWKEYTPKHQAKLDAIHKQKELARIDELNKAFFEKNLFNENGKAYIVLGNTYEIKEQLKEQGAKFNLELGWHFKNEHPNTLEVDLNDLCAINENGLWRYREDATFKIRMMRNGK